VSFPAGTGAAPPSCGLTPWSAQGRAREPSHNGRGGLPTPNPCTWCSGRDRLAGGVPAMRAQRRPGRAARAGAAPDTDRAPGRGSHLATVACARWRGAGVALAALLDGRNRTRCGSGTGTAMTRNARLRRAVIARDGSTCKMLRDGKVCGRPAEHANHRKRCRDGGPETRRNMEAACQECNLIDGGVSRFEHVPPPARLTPVQRLIASALDAAGLRSEAGRRIALRALGGAAKRYRSADVDAACRWRRHRGPIASADPGTEPRNRW
jgi:hypothetical protein